MPFGPRIVRLEVHHRQEEPSPNTPRETEKKTLLKTVFVRNGTDAPSPVIAWRMLPSRAASFSPGRYHGTPFLTFNQTVFDCEQVFSAVVFAE
jgi:hypothetical protein